MSSFDSLRWRYFFPILIFSEVAIACKLLTRHTSLQVASLLATRQGAQEIPGTDSMANNAAAHVWRPTVHHMVLTARQRRHVKCCKHVHMMNPERPRAHVPQLDLLHPTLRTPPPHSRQEAPHFRQEETPEILTPRRKHTPLALLPRSKRSKACVPADQLILLLLQV